MTMNFKTAFQKYLPVASTDSLEKLGTEESERFLRQSISHPESKPSQRRRIIEIVSTMLLTIILIAISQNVYGKVFGKSHSEDKDFIEETIKGIYGIGIEPVYGCGNNANEALALDCVFDMSASGWLPRPCVDEFLKARFEAYSWRYWEDKERTKEVFLDRIAASATEEEPREVFWSEPGFHENHCALMWERMHRAVQMGTRMTTHLLNFNHTHHCGTVMETEHLFTSVGIMPLLNTC